MGDEGDLDFHNVKATGHDRDAVHGSQKRQELVGHANRLIYEAVEKHSRAGALALTLGGDHSIGVGSVAGALKARPETAVVWVDAHADINSPRTSLTGHLHGMVLSFLMDLDKARQARPSIDRYTYMYIGTAIC